MKTLILAIACCLSFTVLAQAGKLKKADSYYEKLSYAHAVNLYEELKGSEVDSPQMTAKLAHSYLKMGANEKAAEYYAEMINSSSATSEDYYNYAFTLKMIGDYNKSNHWMHKFSDVAENDPRAEMFLANPNYKSQIDNTEPFFDVKSMDINSNTSDFGGYLSPDEDVLYFITGRRKPALVKRIWSWDEKGFLDIFYAPIKEDGSYGKAKKVKKVNTRFHEGPIAFSKDGRTVYYTRDNIAPGKKRKDGERIQNLKLYIADVNDKGNWVKEREFPYNSKDYSIGHPSISEDGKTMYLVSDMPGGYGDADIYSIDINPDGSFGEMINLGDKINTPGKEMFPFIDKDGKLFFSSDGHPGLGGLDVYVASLSEDGEVKETMNLGAPINTRYDDFAITLTEDLQTGYVSSNRSDGVGGDDIYSIKSLRPIEFDEEDVEEISLRFLITNAKTGMLVQDVLVELTDLDNGEVITFKSSAAGDYLMSLPDKKLNDEGNYKLELSRDGYFSKSAERDIVFSEVGEHVIALKLTPEFIEPDDEMVVINSILFDFDKYNIRPDAAKTLDEIAAVMNKYPTMVIELGAHTDCRGSRAYNIALSNRRAKSTIDYIVSKLEVNPERIYGKGYGEDRLLNGCACEGEQVSGCSEKEHAINRRTEFKVISVENDDVRVENKSPNSF